MENLRNLGLSNGKLAVMMIVYRQPGANIIGMVDRVKALMPQLRASVSPAIDVNLAVDRSTTIRVSLRDVEITLIIAVILVILVVFAFLRSARATLVPVVAVSVSLIATFAVMYLLGYSLNIFSLMALTVATGFVVDDAIVVLENISRHLDAGKSPLEAALQGSREVGFTVLSMSVSLIAVFVPILLMGGLVGKLFREFAMTITVAIVISLVVSLTTTPMMCAVLLRAERGRPHGRIYRASERALRGAAERLSADAHRRAASSALGDADSGCGPRPEFPSLRGGSEGLRPATGHRAADRVDPGRSKHLVSTDAAEAHAVRRHRQERSGRRHRRRLHRRRSGPGRRLDQLRHRIRLLEAACATASCPPTGDRLGCGANSPPCRAPRCSCRRWGISAPADARATRSISTRCRDRRSKS